MVADTKTSKETLQGFYRSHAELSDDPKLSVHVLTTGSWPLSRTTDSSCNLPIEVSAPYEKSKSYYLGLHTHKKLSLQPNMGNAEIIATFGNGHKHELHVSTYQMTTDTPRKSEFEKLQTRKSVEENIRPQIEAAIARIMKFRKQLDHSNVITEVTKELMSLFLPNPIDIKKRIESLIDRDYLERDSIDTNLYRYLA
ncbi:cullin 3B [Medicago truncatula]|uniref:Cullin 3B n=1 Tax=Medicago truncatula TaxID=3880 RepID=A0A072TY11_MEDTR|nr:cullin 3B [Medicago truncatula]KEH22354.1 cullin 3B [Medicago truncatula]